MYLAIEIGGTKLQLAVGAGEGEPLARVERRLVDVAEGADGIRRQIADIGRLLIDAYPIRAIGVGFGGPVDAGRGTVIKSFHVDGWDGFELAQWCSATLQRPTAIGNDSDLAGLAEARFGGGRGHRVVFYSNVGTGIGGAVVIDGDPYRGATGGACEVGHLRPGIDAVADDQVVEAYASGLGIAAQARRAIQSVAPGEQASAAALIAQCGGTADAIDTRGVARAALAGNELARRVLDVAVQTYGWALGQVVTLMSPHVIVIGGGVSLVDEQLFMNPLRDAIDRYTMVPMRGSYDLVAARLGEEVVLHGAIAWAARSERA